MLDLLRRATPELKSRAGRVPPLEALPTPGDFHELSERRGQLAAQGQRAEVLLTDERFAALPQSSAQDRQAALRAVQDVAQRRTELERRRESWIAPAVEDVLALRDREWKAQLATTRQALSTAESLLQILGGHAVSGLNRIQPDVALGHVASLTQHLTSGKRLKGVFGIAKVAREAEPLLDRVRVDGQPADSIDRLSAVKARIELELALTPVEQLWRLPDGTDLPLTQRIARLQDEEGVLLQVLDFADVHGRAVALMRSMALDVDLGDPEAVNDTRIALDGLRLAGVRQDLEEALAPAVRVLRGVAAAPRAVPSVHRCLQTIADWDTKGYALAYAELANAADANVLLGELTEADDRVRSATPALADRLHAASDDPAWDARLPLLHQAWAWSVWDRRVADKTDPAAEQHWRGVLKSAEREERRALQQLASNRGWAQCLSRLTPHESTHLNMYALAVRKAGKGTGKYVRRHQEDARSSLRQAQTAVPAWIMPMHQVFETVPVDRPNLFDVVIVDEASQSGLEAVLLSWLAPRLVIVGDDKQVSPSNVGMDHEDVYTLHDRYLAGLETKSLFGPMNSFFDQAVARSRSRIMLREHFRCMPEIIGFSNELSYRGELVPLRQYGIDRLPPLRSTFVRGALVSGRRDVVNEAEAQALVEQIAKCCADTAYDGRTMGVLTLLGNAQDKLIMSRLVETLGVREIEERRLRAGNAEAFQGDERHVMFVSMVSSMHSTVGPARIGALNKESDQQRLNVAASRAQDQLWLFHSVHPGDLSEKDLRRRFLQYVIKPTHEQDALDIGEVVADVPHGLFDSLFEQRVFLALRDRGYRVRPQLKVGRYRIDLVVEGGTRRLAVECDGDAYHGVEAHEDDAARQRDLERVGWTFWRVRGSTFYRDPASALEPLWRLLNDLGIEPAEAENIESELHQEVEAVLSAASGATDALAEPELLFEQPPAHRGQHVPDQVAPQPASQVEAEAADPVVPAAPSTARFRDGKMLLTRTARGRVEREREQVEAWLSCPPVPMGVDSRSLAVQRDKQNRHQEDLQDRVDYLQRVLDQSVATDDHRGGDWVTPGCMVGLLFEGEAEPELAVISSMDSSAETTVSPFTELGRVLDGVEVGSSLAYESARGRMTVSVIEILD